MPVVVAMTESFESNHAAHMMLLDATAGYLLR
jgi:hypothetical protein